MKFREQGNYVVDDNPQPTPEAVKTLSVVQAKSNSVRGTTNQVSEINPQALKATASPK